MPTWKEHHRSPLSVRPNVTEVCLVAQEGPGERSGVHLVRGSRSHRYRVCLPSAVGHRASGEECSPSPTTLSCAGPQSDLSSVRGSPAPHLGTNLLCDLKQAFSFPTSRSLSEQRVLQDFCHPPGQHFRAASTGPSARLGYLGSMSASHILGECGTHARALTPLPFPAGPPW